MPMKSASSTAARAGMSRYRAATLWSSQSASGGVSHGASGHARDAQWKGGPNEEKATSRACRKPVLQPHTGLTPGERPPQGGSGQAAEARPREARREPSRAEEGTWAGS
jgi:hypothetical protein